MPPTKRDLRTIGGLRRLVATLRDPDGCPWAESRPTSLSART